MAYEASLTPITLEAGQDLSTKQYYFMVIASDGQVDPAGTAGVNCDGVLQDVPSAAGAAATLAIAGVSKVKAGGSITAGDKIATTNAGKAATATSGQRVLGRALADAADGDLVPVLLKLGGEPNA